MIRIRVNHDFLIDPDMRAPRYPRFAPGDFCTFFAREDETYIYGEIISYDHSQKTYCVTTSHAVNETIYPALNWSDIKKISGRDFFRMNRQEWPDIMNTDGTERMLPPSALRDRKHARNGA